MARRPSAPPFVRRSATIAFLAAGLLSTMVAAQPAQPILLEDAPAQRPVSEEAPPAVVPAPTPLPVPPVDQKEVEPAAPPKAKVIEKSMEAPTRRARYDVAVLQALDKVTAETLTFAAPVGRPVRWKGLIFTVRACERSAPDEPVDDSIVYLTIDSQPRPQPGKPTPPPRQAFKGWMYASSPGLNPMEHPVYDAWLITCKAAAPVKPAGPAAP